MNARSLTPCGLALLVILCGAVIDRAQNPASPAKPTSFLDYAAKFEIVDYDQADDLSKVDTIRKAKNQRYDKQQWVSKNTHPETAGVGKEDELPAPPRIPINQSDLIIIGRVENAKAHLSNDKEGVYTEFNICIEDLLKPDTQNKDAQANSCVAADREGGRVRYPNGQLVFYANSNKGVPWVGTGWLFFLRRDGQSPNYEVITAYQNDEGSINSLDNYFRELNGRRFSDFLDTVKQVIASKSLRK